MMLGRLSSSFERNTYAIRMLHVWIDDRRRRGLLGLWRRVDHHTRRADSDRH
jgi:hypothetical protein